MSAKRRITLDKDFGKRGSREVLEEEKTAAERAERTKAKPFTEAQKVFMRQVFEEVYGISRWKFYRRNFLRGVFFGFGSLIGGTLVVALLIWILTYTVNVFPPVRDFIQQVIDTLSMR